MKDTMRAIFSRARRFFSGTLASRLTGVMRDVTLAAAFGADASVAALMVAYRLSHLLRRLLGEGALQTAFVPQFEQLRNESEETAFRFFRALSLLLTGMLALLIAVGAVVVGVLLATGLLNASQQEVAWLTLLLLPSLLFVCLYGLNVALLQCQNHYFVASAAPAAFNITWVAAVLLLWGRDASAAMPWLAGAIVIACIFQWLVTLPQVVSSWKGRGGWIDFALARRLLTPLCLAATGVAASQINSALDPLFARYAAIEGPSYLWYAIRIQQLPLSLFGIALSSALLPPLTRALQSGNNERFELFLNRALAACTALLVPLSFAYLVAGDSSVNLLFGHSSFTTTATLNTTWCLWGYSLGLLPMGLSLIVASACYAKGNYSGPAAASIKSVAVNIALNAFMVVILGLGPASVAVATSASSWINLLLLRRTLDHPTSFTQPLLEAAAVSLAGSALLVGYSTAFHGIESLAICSWFGGTPSLPRELFAQATTFTTHALLFGVPVVSYWYLQSRRYPLYAAEI